jgi:hypothetical protein
MLAVVLRSPGAALWATGAEESVLEEPECALVRFAEPPAGPTTSSRTACSPSERAICAEDVAERALLLAEVLDLARELGSVVSCSRHLCR